MLADGLDARAIRAAVRQRDPLKIRVIEPSPAME